jgi:hypothetical protein
MEELITLVENGFIMVGGLLATILFVEIMKIMSGRR